MSAKVNAAIYTRISQDRDGVGLGVERQLADCRALARRLGWSVVETFTDNDVSAYSGKPRPGYERMLRAIESGRVTAVLAWHTDRLHRSPVELERYITVCGEDPGVPTRTVQAGEVDLATASGRMHARIMGAVNRGESEKISERQRRKMAEIAEAGRWRGGPRPFGFESDGTTLRSNEAAEIVKAYEAILAGGSLRGIATDWNTRELYGTRGARWEPNTVRQLLLRARNIGMVESRGEIIGEARWPALVAEDTYHAVRSILVDPARDHGAGRRPRWLGSGLYLCGGCERPTLRVSGPASRVRTYRCSQQHPAPWHVSRQAYPLDAYVEKVMVARLSRPDAVELTRSESEPDTTGLHTEAVALRQRLDDLSAAFADGEITRSQLSTGTARLRGKLDDIERQLADAGTVNPLAGIAGTADVARVWFGTAEDRSDGLPLDRRRAAVDTLATVTVLPAKAGRNLRGTIDPDTVRIDWRRG